MVTVLEFSSPKGASNYLKETGSKTLSYAAATYKPFVQVPGAIEADGTKDYAGDYSHGVVAATKDFYFQLVYANALPSPVPIEFYTWAKDSGPAPVATARPTERPTRVAGRQPNVRLSGSGRQVNKRRYSGEHR